MFRDGPKGAWLPTDLTFTSRSVVDGGEDRVPEASDPAESTFSGRGLSTQDILGLRPALSQRPQLTRIDLCNNNLWDRGAQAIADAVRSCPALTQVDVSNNNLGSTGNYMCIHMRVPADGVALQA